jgi:hypothetical protein
MSAEQFTHLNDVDFDSLTIETLDFNTLYPIEYAYRFWQAHRISGKSLREAFWRFMRIHFNECLRISEMYYPGCLYYDINEGFQSGRKFQDLEDYKEFKKGNKPPLFFYLFKWYAPDLLECLTKEDYLSIIFINEEQLMRLYELRKSENGLENASKPTKRRRSPSEVWARENSGQISYYEFKKIHIGGRISKEFEPIPRTIHEMQEEYAMDVSDLFIHMVYKYDFCKFSPEFMDIMKRRKTSGIRIWTKATPRLKEEERTNFFGSYVPFDQQNIPEIIRTIQEEQQFVFFNIQIDEFIRNDDISMVQTWIESNPDFQINKQYKTGYYVHNDVLRDCSHISILDAAIYYNSSDVIQYLIMNGAKADHVTLLIAIMVGNWRLIRICLNNWEEEGLTKVDIITQRRCYYSAYKSAALIYKRKKILQWLEMITDTEDFE